MSDRYIRSLIISGAVFALLIHFISISEIVNFMGFLPKFETQAVVSPKDIFIKLILPPSNLNSFAKLLIVCFLAGFAERLVPDVWIALLKKRTLSRQNKLIVMNFGRLKTPKQSCRKSFWVFV